MAILLLTLWLFRWPVGAEIKVYFMPGFSTEQQHSALSGLNSWGIITYSSAGETDSIKSCHHCLTIQRKESDDPKHFALLHAWHFEGSQTIEYAWIDVSPRTINPKVVQAFLAHESGHLRGLSDCDCPSIMGHASWGINRVPKHVGPTAKDLELAREAYRVIASPVMQD